MVGLLGKLFGAKDEVSKLTDATISGIDRSVFTRQEGAGYLLKMLEAYEPFRLAQRVIAFMVVGVFLALIVSGFSLYLYGVLAASLIIVAQSKVFITLVISVLGNPVIVIIAFYFAGGVVNTFFNKRKKSNINIKS